MKLKNPDLFTNSCLINGEWLAALSGEVIEVSNPLNNQNIANVPKMGKKETAMAIKAADGAIEKWRSKTAEERSNLLKRWAKLILENLDDLAVILTSEQGKALAEAKGEIKYAASFIEWYGEEARRIYGQIIPSHLKNSKILVTKEPVGVCGLIAPWNFPAAMITRKAAPALAAGCTIVIKPASETPLTALALVKLSVQAGIEAGVVNIVTGKAAEIGEELTSNKLVRKISFTGSTETGKLLMKQSAGQVQKISLELGGNAPFLVFEDADLDKAVQGGMAAKFRNSGQTCICVNRFLVQEKIYDQFSKKLAAEVAKLKVGDGLADGVQQGPLINEKAVKHCEEIIADAVKKGAKIIVGGKKILEESGGNFFAPTVITDANSEMRCFNEEIFGPIAVIYKFHDEKEAIKIANDTRFGLASYLYTSDLNCALKLAEKLEYGMVGINETALSTTVAPFGGIKESGNCREGSVIGIEEYLQTKYLLLGNAF